MLSLDNEIPDQIVDVQRKINEYYEIKTKGSIFRSKARWYAEREKSSKYFFNHEKLRYNQRMMTCLVKEDGTISKNKKKRSSKCRQNTIRTYKIQTLHSVLTATMVTSLQMMKECA